MADKQLLKWLSTSYAVPLNSVNYVIYSHNYVTIAGMERHTFVTVIIYSTDLKLILVNIISGKKHKSNRVIIIVIVELLKIKIN